MRTAPKLRLLSFFPHYNRQFRLIEWYYSAVSECLLVCTLFWPILVTWLFMKVKEYAIYVVSDTRLLNKTWVIFITLSLGIMDSKWWSWECPLEWEITLFVYNIETRWKWRPIICMVLYQALFLELFPINKVLYPSFICHWFTGRGEIILAVGIGFGGLCCFGEEAAVDG